MIRQKVMESIRDFFASEGFIEAEAPLLVRSPDLSPNLAPLKTELIDSKGGKHDAFLITSPEFSMKKLLAAGFNKVFSLGKVFRNGEPWGGSHNPEFTMLEWYRAGADYRKMMDDTERLVKFCADACHAEQCQSEQCRRPVEARQEKTGLSILRQAQDDRHGAASRSLATTEKPWKRLSIKETFAGIGLNLDDLLTRDTMAKAAADRGYRISANDSFDDCFFKIFLTEIEPKLCRAVPTERRDGAPSVVEGTILYDYPVQMAALARPKPEDPRYAERFEVFLGGLELCNCFSELTDPAEQRRRFEKENEERRRLGKEKPPIDEDLLAALGKIRSATGNALGVDRLVMLLTGAKSIEDVMLFPASELFK
jgi:elongation factor P--(R)-beta-lysine ligase